MQTPAAIKTQKAKKLHKIKGKLKNKTATKPENPHSETGNEQNPRSKNPQKEK